MHEYETVFILDPGLDENQVNEQIEKTQTLITSHGGKILDVQRWGRKRLAYEINKKRDGVYTLFKHESTGETVKELERRLRLDENVMRVMTVIAGPAWEVPAEGEPGAPNLTGIDSTPRVAAVAAPVAAPVVAPVAPAAPAVVEGAGE